VYFGAGRKHTTVFDVIHMMIMQILSSNSLYSKEKEKKKKQPNQHYHVAPFTFEGIFLCVLLYYAE